MKKFFALTTVAAAALALAACQEVEDVPVDENAAAQVELNEDGSVATPTEEATEDEAI